MAFTATDLRDLCGELRALNERIFPQRVEIAYHALAGAMHCAHDARDIGAIDAIAELAERQAHALSEAAPPKSAIASEVSWSTVRIYGTLAQQARAMAETLRAQARLHDLQRPRT